MPDATAQPKRRYREDSGLAAALDVVGRRWTLLVVRELLSGAKRYGELLSALPGIGTNLLVNRLRELEAAGAVRRSITQPPASLVLYELTDRGRELELVIRALSDWGSRARDS
jgi:DNA-binding HxlR family transcriptional regulator